MSHFRAPRVRRHFDHRSRCDAVTLSGFHSSHHSSHSNPFSKTTFHVKVTDVTDVTKWYTASLRAFPQSCEGSEGVRRILRVRSPSLRIINASMLRLAQQLPQLVPHLLNLGLLRGLGVGAHGEVVLVGLDGADPVASERCDASLLP
jgi:hypothetical protein